MFMSATMATTEKQWCGYKPAATSTMLQLEMTLFCEVFLARWVDSGCGWLVASIFYKTSYLLLKGLVSHTTKETTRVATVPKLIIDCSVTIEGRLLPLAEMTYSGFPHLGCAFWFLIPAGTNLIFRIPPDFARFRPDSGRACWNTIIPALLYVWSQFTTGYGASLGGTLCDTSKT